MKIPHHIDQMTIEIDEKVYRTPWKYYRAFVEAFGTCCGTCNEDTLFAVEKANRLDKMNLQFVGIEIDKEYIDKAIKRIEQYCRQGTLSF